MFVDTCSVIINNSNNKPVGPAQASVDLLRAECAMFESLINLDIAQALNESGQISISESEINAMLEVAKTDIVTRIKNIIIKIKNTIEQFVQKISDKLGAVLNKDKRLFSKYEKAYDEAIKGNITEDKEGEYEIPNYSMIELILDESVLKKAKLNETLNSLSVLGSPQSDYAKQKKIKELCEAAIDVYDKQCKDTLSELQTISKHITEKKTGKLLSLISTIKNNIKNNIDVGKSVRIKALKANANVDRKLVDEMNAKAKLARDSVQPSSDNIYRYNAILSIAIASHNLINKSLRYQFHTIKKQYAVERKLFVQVAKLAKSSGDSKEATKESAVSDLELWAIGEASDMYIEEAFSDIY